MKSRIDTVVALALANGTLLAVTGSLLWHYATDTVPGTYEAGDGAVYGEYRPLRGITIVEPSTTWWPASLYILIFATICSGVSYLVTRWLIRHPSRKHKLILIAALSSSVCATFFGLVLALAGYLFPPTRSLQPAKSTGMSSDTIVYQATFRLDLSPTWVVYPCICVAACLIASFAVKSVLGPRDEDRRAL